MSIVAHVRTLLSVLLFATQLTAVVHELAHVFGQHQAPCALHEAADHHVVASAPGPTPSMAPALAADVAMPPDAVAIASHAHPTAARAPPLAS
jgi:hypothetical protein